MCRHILQIFIEMNYATSCLSSCRIANVHIHCIIEIGTIKCISSLKLSGLQSSPSQKTVGLALDLKKGKEKQKKGKEKVHFPHGGQEIRKVISDAVKFIGT